MKRIKFSDCYEREGLIKIDNLFEKFFEKKDKFLFKKYKELKDSKDSNILIEISKILEDFIVEIFDIKEENQNLRKHHDNLSIIYETRLKFIQRNIAKNYKESDVKNINGIEILKKIDKKLFNLVNKKTKLSSSESELFEISLSRIINNSITKDIEIYCAFALYNSKGIELHKNGSLFSLPKKINKDNLVDYKVKKENQINIIQALDNQLKNARDNLDLYDKGHNLNQILKETKYCIFCHKRNKDSCKIGLKNRDTTIKKDELGNILSGCPVDQKISEMNLLKSEGFSISALAIAISDNPMIMVTGHRICNDCMKSCIYQMQEPVNIPQIESKIVKDVLNLPYGFEIYSLLAKWNPINYPSILLKEESGYKICIAGLGPSGFALSYYLLNQGHLVVAIDGLKIEPIDNEFISRNKNNVTFKPIKNINNFFRENEEKMNDGFGGVMQYGITSRWNKNLLKLLRIFLERYKNFLAFGSIKLGTSLKYKEVFGYYKFDHLALCLGTGRPNLLNIKNDEMKGIFSSSDFLMSLQLSGANKKELLSNFQIRLPIIIIGGGLTAIDTAVEAITYYIFQVKKFFFNYQRLLSHGVDLLKTITEEEKNIAEEFINHAIILNNSQESERLNLIRKWGGVKILYRREIKNSAAYKLNHEELQNALYKGVEIIENADVIDFVEDEYNSVKEVEFQKENNQYLVKSRTILVAIGTKPNNNIFKSDGKNFNFDEEGNFKIIKDEFINKINKKNKSISIFGDLNEKYNGSVVKAIASAKNGSKIVDYYLKQLKISNLTFEDFSKKISKDFTASIKKINIFPKLGTELIIHSPLMAKKTKLGHIFRLNNYSNFAESKKEIKLVIENIPLTSFKINSKKNLIHFFVVNVGSSTDIVNSFKEKEIISLMGPSGISTKILKKKKVIFISQGRGNIPITFLAKEFKDKNCDVTLICEYNKQEEIIWLNKMKKSCKRLIITLNNSDLNSSNNSVIFQEDISIILNNILRKEEDVDLIFTIGNEDMISKIGLIYEKYKKLNKKSIASLNSPMQCMLKGVCSRCLQKRINKKTNKVTYFYSCANQEISLDEISIDFLKAKCNQHSLQEKLSKYLVSALI